jgi:hypothetical protein
MGRNENECYSAKRTQFIGREGDATNKWQAVARMRNDARGGDG